MATTTPDTTPAANQTKFNEEASNAFLERMIGTLNSAGLSMMISIGHRTGLFETMAKLPAATSTEIAEAAKLNERYVREWLGAMATGRVVEYDAEAKTYRLPAEHARWLTDQIEPGNFAVTHQWTSVLGYVESPVVEKFQKGGGVHYECFHRFHEVMADESSQSVVDALNEFILPLVPGLRDQLQQGICLLDIGCGSGKALCALAAEFPNSQFTGYDLCEDAVQAATAEACKQGLTNVKFETRDITAMSDPDAYDIVTAFDVIHDQKDPAAVLVAVHNTIKPGGAYLMQDIRASSYVENNMEHPMGPFLYTISTMHCMTVSLAQDGEGLGTVWGEELAVKMLDDAGFNDVRVETLPHDMLNNYYVMTK